MNRIILHVDMNAFFASVEQQSNPALRGKPIAVIGSHERTVVTTSSYEARAYGVKTGMTKYEARRLCPHIILVVIQREDVGKLLENLPVKELCGIGPRLETHLATMGISTCGELGRTSIPVFLISIACL